LFYKVEAQILQYVVSAWTDVCIVPLLGTCVGEGGDVRKGGVMVYDEGEVCNCFVATENRRV